MPETATAQNEDQILAVSEALDKFAAEDQVKADWVKLRSFVGMTAEEAPEARGISNPTATRYRAYAHACLATEKLVSRRRPFIQSERIAQRLS
jgi:hypothetical protein